MKVSNRSGALCAMIGGVLLLGFVVTPSLLNSFVVASPLKPGAEAKWSLTALSITRPWEAMMGISIAAGLLGVALLAYRFRYRMNIGPVTTFLVVSIVGTIALPLLLVGFLWIYQGSSILDFWIARENWLSYGIVSMLTTTLGLALGRRLNSDSNMPTRGPGLDGLDVVPVDEKSRDGNTILSVGDAA